MRSDLKALWVSLRPFPVTTVIIATFIVLAPLAVNRHVLPIGWEIPKVCITQIFSLILLVSFGIEAALSHFRNPRKLSMPRLLAVVTTALLMIALISSFFSEYAREAVLSTQTNSLYRLLESAGIETSKIAVYGNPFRDFGLLSFISVLLIGGITMTSIKENSRKILMYAFILSALLQSLIGIYQFADLYRAETLSPFSGTWIAGTFGQANFFAGHLLAGLILSLYFLKNGGRWDFLFLVPVILILGGLLVSFSTWAIILAALSVLLILTYEAAPAVLKSRLFSTILAISAASALVVLAYLYSTPQTDLYRTYIWKNTIETYLVEPANDLSPENTRLILFGSGLDTLGEKFEDEGKLPGNYVDRAHNVFLSTTAAFGVSGLLALLVLFSILLYSWLKNIQISVVFYIGLAALIWIARSFIHTSSIINITDATIILSLLAGSLFHTTPSTTNTRSA